MSSQREPKRSASLPACQASIAGNTENVAASKPTVAGAAPSWIAYSVSTTRPARMLLMLNKPRASAKLMDIA